MKPVFMPPDAATLMWSTRAIGYTTQSAIADLIDTSISANASIIPRSLKLINLQNKPSSS